MKKARIKKYDVSYLNAKEYRGLKREIFGEQIYYVEMKNPSPYIIDAGAYIGISTLYFKDTYPDSQVLAIEPNPAAVTILEENIWQNALSDVWIYQAALWPNSGTANLYMDASDDRWYSVAGLQEGAWDKTQKSSRIAVPAVTLSEILDDGRPVDLLKLDIEGAEHEVIKEAGKALKRVRKLIVEHHPIQGEDWQDLARYLEHLGFAIQVTKGGRRADPHQRTEGLTLIRARRN